MATDPPGSQFPVQVLFTKRLIQLLNGVLDTSHINDAGRRSLMAVLSVTCGYARVSKAHNDA